jgi:hypothetical protein
MPRDLSPAFITELESGIVRPALLVEIEFESSTLRLWSGVGDLVYNSNTFLGNGWLSGIRAAKEEGEVSPRGMEVTMTGIPTSLVSLILGQSVQNRDGTIFLGFLDAAGDVVQDPFPMYKGSLDVPKLTESSSGPVIVITIENRLLDLNRPRNYRFTDASQKTFYPDDRGFEYVATLQDWDGRWGGTKDPTKKKKKKKRRRRRG